MQYSRVEESRHGHTRVMRSSPPAIDLPILGNVPSFSLLERRGKKISLTDLAGKVWIADFIFTTCGGPCPIMTNRMKLLRDELAKQGLSYVTTVSVTVDPETDTPNVLSEYASVRHAESDQWLFLTGDEKDIFDLSVKGFKLPAEREKEGSENEVLHSPRFILVDQQGRIRGYYDVVTNEEIEELPRAEVFDKPMNAQTQEKLIKDIRALLTTNEDS